MHFYARTDLFIYFPLYVEALTFSFLKKCHKSINSLKKILIICCKISHLPNASLLNLVSFV